MVDTLVDYLMIYLYVFMKNFQTNRIFQRANGRFSPIPYIPVEYFAMNKFQILLAMYNICNRFIIENDMV